METIDKVVTLKKENGKKITVDSWGNHITVKLWRKNDSIFITLIINIAEAHKIKNLLENAIKEARQTQSLDKI